MTKKSAAPSIRFKGFSDAWEQRKLQEFVEFYSGLTYTPTMCKSQGLWFFGLPMCATVRSSMLIISMSILMW